LKHLEPPTTHVSQQLDVPFGSVFTPELWARWAVRTFQIAESWIRGASILEPTAGSGNFVLALIEEAIVQGCAVADVPLERLFVCERNPEFAKQFVDRLHERFGLSLPERHLIVDDILFTSRAPKVDIVLGNPPWGHLADVSTRYANALKGLFIELGVVKPGPHLRLGNSRADISALFMAKLLRDSLRSCGKLYFFMPRAVFFNGGAHDELFERNLLSKHFAIESLHDFDDDIVFRGVGTRYVLAAITRDKPQNYPINVNCRRDGKWNRETADRSPLDASTLYLRSDREQHSLFEKIAVRGDARPRQGANTCGANSVLIFDELLSVDGDEASFRKGHEVATLPIRLVFPLIDSVNFGEDRPIARRWILLPHRPDDGKPLTETELMHFKSAWVYLAANREALKARSSLVLKNYIAGNQWWALFGVGTYSFAPYKICWQAYGTHEFKARAFEPDPIFGPWQGNQAMHATMSFKSLDEAKAMLSMLESRNIEEILTSTGAQGTKSWAQPGRMSKLFFSIY
jgi:hypothetical protein